MNKSQEREALLDERRGYIMRGKTARVKDVDAALRALGDDDEPAEIETATNTPTVERAIQPRRKRR